MSQLNGAEFLLWGHILIHKPRGQFRREGVIQTNILLHKPYVKVPMKGELGRGSKIPKNVITWFMDDPYGFYAFLASIDKTQRCGKVKK